MYDGSFAETRDAEAEVLPQAGDVAGVEGFALAGGFGADGVSDAVGENVLEGRWGVEGREVGGRGEGPGGGVVAA